MMTDKDDEYKRIIDDAVDYVTRQAWTNQNTLRVTHFQPDTNAMGEPEVSTNIFQALQIGR